MKRRWTEEEIWDWYREHEWITGFNFIPSNSMTGSVYYFQSYHHEEAFKDAAKELALAAFRSLTASVFPCPLMCGGRNTISFLPAWMNCWICWKSTT